MTKRKRNWLIIGGVAVVLIGGGVYGAMTKKPKIEYTTADVTRGTLVQTVNETGTITPAKEIDLNFMNSGQLLKLGVKVGDQVIPDQVLAQIDFSGLAIKQQEAESSLQVAQANVGQSLANAQSAQREYERLSASLNEALKQAQKTQSDLEDRSPATMTTYEQAISTAESSLASSNATYQRGIDNKTAALGLTIENKQAAAVTSMDQVKRLLDDSDARPTLSARNSSYLNMLNSSYDTSKDLQTKSAAAIAAFKANSSQLENAYNSEQITLNSAFETLTYAYRVLENTITSSSFTQAELDAYKTAIDAQTTQIANAISSAQTAKQALDDARLAYDTNRLSAEQNVGQAKTNYDNALRSARNAAINAQLSRDQQLASAQTRVDSAHANVAVVSAQVGQAQANLNLVRDQIADTMLKSPIKGVITKVNYQVGEQVTPTKALVSVLTENNYQLEVDIAETDISKVKIGDDAVLTLDSLGKDVPFQGKVYFIEPAATVIQGVTYYKLKISFDPGTQPVKPGMTAEAVITTARRENVLMMPSRAVVEKEGKKLVRILENGQPRENEVMVGLSGDDGMVEVLSGVNEGDKVVTFIKDPSKK